MACSHLTNCPLLTAYLKDNLASQWHNNKACANRKDFMVTITMEGNECSFNVMYISFSVGQHSVLVLVCKISMFQPPPHSPTESIRLDILLVR
jgi:hypothetical protein